jgi:hypothetical protein
MSKDSVMAYWVEDDNFDFCSKSMGNIDIFRGGTYENEVITKYAREPLDFEVVIIPFNQMGSDWAKSEVQRLKDKSAELRQANGK